jgi:RHS repeat-associated protein
MKIETGSTTGTFFYTRDHLGSIRELTDAGGNVRARYTYDPYGRRTKLTGDVEADFGFAGMFWAAEANLNLTHFRAYDPGLGRWLSRDPLKNVEVVQGPNLYAYAANDPVNLIDPSGLAWDEAALRGRYTPEQVEMILAKQRGEQLWDWRPDSWGPRAPKTDPLEVPEKIGGELTDDLSIGELQDVKAATRQIPNRKRPSPYRAPEPRRTPYHAPEPNYPGLSGAFSIFVDSGITILTMTDCNTVNGIFGLVRQGKGGLLNIYEDQMMKQLEEEQ